MESPYGDKVDYGSNPSHGQAFLSQAEFLEHATSSPYHSRWKPDHQYEGAGVNATLSKDGHELEEFNSGGKFLDKQRNGNIQQT
jgi:hypothetical protein